MRTLLVSLLIALSLSAGIAPKSPPIIICQNTGFENEISPYMQEIINAELSKFKFNVSTASTNSTNSTSSTTNSTTASAPSPLRFCRKMSTYLMGERTLPVMGAANQYTFIYSSNEDLILIKATEAVFPRKTAKITKFAALSGINNLSL